MLRLCTHDARDIVRRLREAEGGGGAGVVVEVVGRWGGGLKGEQRSGFEHWVKWVKEKQQKQQH